MSVMPCHRTGPPARGLVLLGLLMGSALLAGCFGEDESPVEVSPYLTHVTGAPARTLQLAAHLLSTDSFKQTLPVTIDGLPARWTYEAHPAEITIAGRAAAVVLVNVTPSSEAAVGAQTLRLKVGDTGADVVVDVQQRGTTAVGPGMGVALEFVAWSANGSVVATNAPRYQNGTGIPNATDHPAASTPPNATHPYLGYAPSGDAAEDARMEAAGYARLPARWLEALLRGPDGHGAAAGDLVAVGWRASDVGGEPGFVLRVIDVMTVEAPAPPDPTT